MSIFWVFTGQISTNFFNWLILVLCSSGLANNIYRCLHNFFFFILILARFGWNLFYGWLIATSEPSQNWKNQNLNENRNKRALVVGTRDIFFPISGYTKFGEFFPKIAKSVKFTLQNKLPKLSHIFVGKKKHS